MAKYDGLIIPRSYNDYVNKSDPIGVSQALQLTGVMDNVPTAQSTKPAKSGGIFAANAVIMANNKTLSGVAISAGSVVRVLFTAALTGSDAETGLTLTYNGNAYAVKVGKDGALVALTAHLIEESYIYLQAYTTLELAFDGSQFVVMGNPVVISNADFSIMADGSITYKNVYKQYSLTSSVSGDVIDIENIKRLVLANIEKYNVGTSIINFDSQSQKGTLILSKTENTLFSFFYITGYLAYTIYRQYINGWNE